MSASRTAPRTATSAYGVAASVPDPELPFLTLADLGILRDVEQAGDAVIVTITPTYSGCPAMREITADLRHRLERAGFTEVTIRTRLAPAWTSDWISDEGRRKLVEAGIAPPHAAPQRNAGPVPLTLTSRARAVACPQCGSSATRETAPFSGTACKALYRCAQCGEPFEYVKEI